MSGSGGSATLGRCWRWKWLLSSALLASLLLASWFHPFTRSAWDRLDMVVFLALNETLSLGRPWQAVWGLANNRAFDVLIAAFYLALYLHFAFSDERRWVRGRLAFGCFIFAYAFIWLELARNVIFTFARSSPTLVVDGAVRLSELVPWANLKDFSGNSFPGDHAIALTIFTVMTWHRAGRRYGAIALGAALVFVMPRMVSGAHWASDLLVGSTFIALVALSLALATPLHAVASRSLESAMGFGSALAGRLGAQLRNGRT